MPVMRGYFCAVMRLKKTDVGRSRMILSGCLLALAAFDQGHAHAQEHPFIARYELTELSGAVRVDWVLQGGNTCNGQEVERSTDGSTFVAVHRILGICGDPEAAVPYEWIDASPPELSVLYYRVKLGFDGYTSVKSIFFEQLITEEQRFYPSPATGEASLLLNAPTGTPVDVEVYNLSGRSMFTQRGNSGPLVRLDLGGLTTGTYMYRAVADGRAFVGRFVKE